MKIGDIVKIKSREWYYNNETFAGVSVFTNLGVSIFRYPMLKYCGKKYRIKRFTNDISIVLEDLNTKKSLPYFFAWWMFESEPKTYVNVKQYKACIK